jgi:hypothetical protein
VLGGELAGCAGFDRVGCSPNAHIGIKDVVDLFQKDMDFGHHLARVYGDVVEEVRELGRIMGFELAEA